MEFDHTLGIPQKKTLEQTYYEHDLTYVFCHFVHTHINNSIHHQNFLLPFCTLINLSATTSHAHSSISLPPLVNLAEVA